MNENFEKVFTDFKEIKSMMKKATCDTQIEVAKDRYREAMKLAKITFNTYSTPEKFKAFKQRENDEVTAILQAYKRRQLGILVNNYEYTPKISSYDYYNTSNYESDLEAERKYWADDLFPKAFEAGLSDFELSLVYSKHLSELGITKKACNPSVRFSNEMRRQFSIYRRKQVGEDASFFEKIGPFA